MVIGGLMAWLEDKTDVCCGSHMCDETRIVMYAGGMYQKMCRGCYKKQYPQYDYDELGRG